ncbi:hypothetical protein F2Q69_00023388 [Brassica cretica]|uniref:Uncharacterized protein n=1 Tax=Brassica cretica TaxID=69181 RepID=A0A8S9QF06_BRACR|nr:hypothetical protein F2Q69_00023388 [Brassica cretica]
MAPDKEPWGKAAQATRHRIRVGKRAAGIIKIPLSTESSIAKGSYFHPYWTHTSSWDSAMQKEVCCYEVSRSSSMTLCVRQFHPVEPK